MGRTSEFPSRDARADSEASVDGEGTARRGMSRRQLIRNAGIAGAVAWTAPVIIDSVSSAALATVPSGCGNRYYMKLVGRGTGAGSSYDPGDCYNAGPLCVSGDDPGVPGKTNTSNCTSGGGYRWVCDGNASKKGTFADSNSSSYSAGTYTVTLAAGCKFNSSETDFMAVGNYNWVGSGGNCRSDVGSVVVTTGGNTAVFQKSVLSGSRVLDYMYLEFVCI